MDRMLAAHAGELKFGSPAPTFFFLKNLNMAAGNPCTRKYRHASAEGLLVRKTRNREPQVQ